MTAQERYYIKHRVEINKRNMRNYYSNKEKHRERQRKYEVKIRELSRTDKSWHAKSLIKSASHRARVQGVPFALRWTDIKIPNVCPILGIPLIKNKVAMCEGSATIDKIIPSLGYVPGNVIVISNKANRIKQNATPDEILRVGRFYANLVGQPDQTIAA